MEKGKWILWGLLAALGVFSGCGKSTTIAAMVNGQVITEQEVDDRMSRLSPSHRGAIDNDRKRLLEEMVMETVLVQEARRRNLDGDAEVVRLLKEARKQVLLGRLFEVLRQGESVDVTDQEVAQSYQANQKAFSEPESWRASHILVETEEAAKKALERIKGGEPFAKVASEVSTDPTKAKGGDIGFFAKGQLIPEFEAACMGMKPGQMSGVVKSALGYHIILLTEHRAPRVRPVEEVKDQIRRQLLNQRQQGKLEATIQQLRSKAQVQIRGASAAPAPARVGAPTGSNPQATSSKPPNS